jgi:hypothetical protein
MCRAFGAFSWAFGLFIATFQALPWVVDSSQRRTVPAFQRTQRGPSR